MGIRRVQAHQGPLSDRRLPVTIEVLRHLRHHWKENCSSPDKCMLWAAACTGFFGFLRAGEFTVPSESQYDPEVHLNLADISVDSHSAPFMFSVLVKQSKTGPFWLGVQVYLGAIHSDICPQ